MYSRRIAREGLDRKFRFLFERPIRVAATTRGSAENADLAKVVF